jgi:hypothetical protein
MTATNPAVGVSAYGPGRAANPAGRRITAAASAVGPAALPDATPELSSTGLIR